MQINQYIKHLTLGQNVETQAVLSTSNKSH